MLNVLQLAPEIMEMRRMYGRTSRRKRFSRLEAEGGYS